MDVRVSYLGLVRLMVGDGVEVLRARPESTIGEFLEFLAERHGSPFRESVYRRDGRLRSFTQVCVDDRDIDDLQGLQTTLVSGEEVSIVVGVYPAEGG
jgi:molybdopterin converting factor small subunit